MVDVVVLVDGGNHTYKIADAGFKHDASGRLSDIALTDDAKLLLLIYEQDQLGTCLHPEDTRRLANERVWLVVELERRPVVTTALKTTKELLLETSDAADRIAIKNEDATWTPGTVKMCIKHSKLNAIEITMATNRGRDF